MAMVPNRFPIRVRHPLYIATSGHFQFEKTNYESIPAYAKKLNEIIDATLTTTGRSKVKIVAHSMGGLVVREYLRVYGNDKVDTFIMMGTPNHGIVDETQTLCPAFGATLECRDMNKGSSFLDNLEGKDKLPARTYTIAGLYRSKTSVEDGIVLESSVELDGVQHYVWRSDKIDGGYLRDGFAAINLATLVHNDLIKPQEAPDVTMRVAELLELD